MNELRVSPVMNPHETKRHENFTDVLHTEQKKKKRSESLLRCFYVGNRKAPYSNTFHGNSVPKESRMQPAPRLARFSYRSVTTVRKMGHWLIVLIVLIPARWPSQRFQPHL